MTMTIYSLMIYTGLVSMRFGFAASHTLNGQREDAIIGATIEAIVLLPIVGRILGVW